MNNEGKVLPVVLAFAIIIQLAGGFIIDNAVKYRQIININGYQKYSYHMTEASLQWYLHHIQKLSSVDDIADSKSLAYSDLFQNENLPHAGVAEMQLVKYDVINQLLHLRVDTTTYVEDISYPIKDRIEVMYSVVTHSVTNRTKTAF